MARYPSSRGRRLRPDQRAGTHLSSASMRVYGSVKGMESHVGMYDPIARVLQVGGELDNFLFHRENALTLPFQSWKEYRDVAERLEFIDNNENLCYAISVQEARDKGWAYDAGIGPRWAVKLDEFVVEDPLHVAEIEEPEPVAAGGLPDGEAYE